ncbi:ABC transporter permease [Plantibacter sp. Mn2098]|uniref:ABC transporter permease n=1 Tax=Plantibacter sp. Mn2098 TaxID=3395266 RepID=UPI003BDA2769
MNAPTTTATTRNSAPAAVPREYRLTFWRVVRSELLKLVTVRTVLVTLLVNIPLGVLFLLTAKGNATPGGDVSENLVHFTYLQGGFAAFACLTLSIVAVLSIANEHSTGQIGSTMRTVPRRWMLVVAKTVALGSLVWLVGFITSTICAVVLAGSMGPLPDGALATILLTSACSGLAWAALAVISLAIGGILRSGAFGIATAFTLFLVLPTVIRSIPELDGLMSVLPTVASSALAAPVDVGAALGGAIALGAWVVVTVGLWGALLSRRDV